MKIVLNWLLLISFIVTVLAPATGIVAHKMASMLFLVLCLVHTIVYWKKMSVKRWGALAMVFAAFISGVLALVMEHIPMVLAAHKVVSIALVFVLAIHIFVFHKRMRRK